MDKNKYLPQVSVIVPCRNEEKFISVCLDSIVGNDYPKDKLEVLVVDGMSKDKTREIVEEYAGKYGFVKLLDNPRFITPAAMNIGIENSKGEIIVKMDAHSIYKKNYITKCVEHLIESGADNVGGVLKSVPADKSIFAKGIALSLSSFFGAGNSWFRTGSKRPREVDTVAFGCYRKRIFDKVGLFNEKMAKIEDFELNQRIRKAGGKIILFPDIQAEYIPSSDNLFDFFIHNFTDGSWTTYSLKFGFSSLSFRHLLPLFFVLTLPLSIWLYFPVSLFFSARLALREKDSRLFFVMPLAFGTRHIGYGIGSLIGLIKLILPEKQNGKA